MNGKAGGCKCRSRRGRRKTRYRSPEQAQDAIERYEMTDAEVYRCPAPGDGWHLRHEKWHSGRVPPGSATQSATRPDSE